MTDSPSFARRVLIVDDEKNIRTTFARALELDGFCVESAATGATAMEAVASFEPELVLLDLRLPDGSGLGVLDHMQALSEPPAVVMMSGHGTLEAAMQATRLGAIDFLEKPLVVDRVLLTIRNALKMDDLDRACHAMQRAIVRRHGMVGQSAVMQKLLADIQRAAPSKARVLITGESGVGKELVARAIHELSGRSAGPFIRMNSAAMAPALVDSELFGHERGAFTGADRRHEGRFERAHEGTLFLDEIGEMPMETQARLLRVLQEGELERVGGRGLVEVDVRVIAATHRDLQQEVDAGRFREDLYYRLSVLPLHVAPLRRRRDDIPELATYLLQRSCEEHELDEHTYTPEALKLLVAHEWPGNIRQLAHAIDRLAIMTARVAIGVDDVRRVLPGAPLSDVVLAVPDEGELYPLLQSFERQLIEGRLARLDYKVAATARDLGLERSHLYKKMRQLGIELPPRA